MEAGPDGWYPAAADTGFGAPTYASDAMLAFYGMAAGDMAPVAVAADIHAAPELSGDPAPLVVFAPGGSSWVELSTHLATELASHGYVVFTDQPDAARVSRPTNPHRVRPTLASRSSRRDGGRWRVPSCGLRTIVITGIART